jgi:hypothetical protein
VSLRDDFAYLSRPHSTVAWPTLAKTVHCCSETTTAARGRTLPIVLNSRSITSESSSLSVSRQLPTTARSSRKLCDLSTYLEQKRFNGERGEVLVWGVLPPPLRFSSLQASSVSSSASGIMFGPRGTT